MRHALNRRISTLSALLQAAGSGRTNLGVHPMGYHNDNADIVFLLCVKRAPSGGIHKSIVGTQSGHGRHDVALHEQVSTYTKCGCNRVEMGIRAVWLRRSEEC